MKRMRYACVAMGLASAVFLFGTLSLSYGGTRNVQNINANWKFNQGDVPNAQSPVVSDAAWQTIQLPHTPAYTNYELTMTTTAFWRGICWYRKTLTVDAALQGKKLFLEFEGAMTVAQVYVNGTPVRTHSGGFTPFSIDISGNVTYGSSNLIAVRLDNTCQGNVPPEKPGDCFIDFTLYGGIYRDVNLIATDSLYISSPLLSPGGTFITTPAVSASSATVKVKTVVKNEHAAAKTCILRTTIIDRNGATVGTAQNSQSIAANGVYAFVQNITVSSPTLWSPINPALYRAITEVYDMATLVDAVNTRFGIRTISFNRTSGFYLNGSSLKLLGVNRHQQYPHIGHALPDRAQYRDAKVLKDMGCNYIRLSHYPQSPAFLDALDELGIMCWEEVPSWFGSNLPDVWKQNHYNDIRDMIRRDRNHPSVIIWGVGLNEGSQDVSFENVCESTAKAEDSTRYTTTARNYSTTTNPFDIYGFNYFDPPLPTAIPDAHSIGFINSEYTGHTYPTHRWDDETTLMECARRHLAMITTDRENAYCAGGTGWCAFDYTSDPDDYPTDGGQEMGTKYHGVMDIFRIPKIAYYVYKSQSAADNYNGALHPMVFIETFNNYPMPSTQTVKMLSNCDSIELFVNGVSQGTRAPDAGFTGQTTRWCACDGNANHWWMVDLGAGCNLTGTQITWEQTTVIYKYRIETSPNSTTWTTAVDKTGNTSINPQQESDAFTANGVRYVRITVTGVTGGWASFYDFKVFSGGINVALKKTATADCSQSGHEPLYAVDDETANWGLAHPPFTFSNINYASPGTLRADGKIGGTVVATQTLYRPGTASKVTLLSDTDTLLADGSDIARVVVSIQDNNSTLIRSATNTVTVSASGAGKVICSSAGPVTSGSVTVRGGQLGFLVQAGTAAGTVTITATSGTLAQAQKTITVVAPQTVGVRKPMAGALTGNAFVIPAIRVQGRNIVFENLDKRFSSRIMLLSLDGRIIGNVEAGEKTSFLLRMGELSCGMYVAVLKNGMHTVRRNIALLR